MTNPSRKEELERRLEQSRRLLKDANDPTTKERISLLIGDLEQQQQQETEK
jgi:preprotein translocase subunit Sss1